MWKFGGERVLRTCGGMKLIRACLETDGRETTLSPSAAHINFIVPSHGLLRKLQPIGSEFPSTRPSGIFQDVLSALQQNANPSVCYDLQYDGKLMKQGLTQSHGDIDCLGEENGTTLSQRREEHEQETEFLVDFDQLMSSVGKNTNHGNSIPSHMIPPVRRALQKLHILLSAKMEELRRLKNQKLCDVAKFKKQGGDNWRESRFGYAIDHANTTLHIVENTLTKMH